VLGAVTPWYDDVLRIEEFSTKTQQWQEAKKCQFPEARLATNTTAHFYEGMLYLAGGAAPLRSPSFHASSSSFLSSSSSTTPTGNPLLPPAHDHAIEWFPWLSEKFFVESSSCITE
jgi:hypothetical protein